MPKYIGLDLGGTNIKAGLLDGSGAVLSKCSVPTQAEQGAEAIVNRLVDAARRVAREANVDLADVDAAGVGSPGPIDFKAGIIRSTPNLKGFVDFPLRDRLATALGRPVVLENDANAAAFGEYWTGAGRGDDVRDLVMLTLGTGIGTGVIIDGCVIHGAFSNGGEGGHMIVVPGGRQCGCGQRGCLEAYASASHTAKRTLEAMESSDQPSALRTRLASDGPESITAEYVFEAANSGDALATTIVDDTARYLGLACLNICRLIEPRVIVFAGGMTLAGDFLFDRIRRTVREENWTMVQLQTEIAPAQLGNDAGMIGAAAVARDAADRGVLPQAPSGD